MPKQNDWPKEVAAHVDSIGKAHQTAFERLKKVEAAREKGEAELGRAVSERQEKEPRLPRWFVRVVTSAR